MKLEVKLPDSTDKLRIFFGQNDVHLRTLRAQLGVSIVARGGMLMIDGEEERVAKAENITERLLEAIDKGQVNLADELSILMEQMSESRISGGVVYTERKTITGRTDGQKNYLQAIRQHSLVFGLGPAGTGKTYLAVACAVEALRHGNVKRIVLTRPAVEAGERLGFLPGDLREKVDPYLRPIYDALEDMLSRRQLASYIENGVIEVAPLAFMRGRTLSRSFVILDEAQNTTPGQMKMLLTRLGPYSRCVVTGDVTQIDLDNPTSSGLIHASRILADIEDVAVMRLGGKDIVRHKLVQSIVKAYHNDDGGAHRDIDGEAVDFDAEQASGQE